MNVTLSLCDWLSLRGWISTQAENTKGADFSAPFRLAGLRFGYHAAFGRGTRPRGNFARRMLSRYSPWSSMPSDLQ